MKKGIDFDEIFSPVVKMTSIRTILSLVVVEDLHFEKLDVKTTFLHEDLEEEIYMQQPQGYEVKGKEKLVCRLKKSLYGKETISKKPGRSGGMSIRLGLLGTVKSVHKWEIECNYYMRSNT